MKIPKILSHVWIGPRPAPVKWMETWKALHPDWDYVLIDNNYLSMNRFKNQHLIDEYMKRGKYAGVADLIRYEFLYENGGVMAGADSVCQRNTEELFQRCCGYVVYENEKVRGNLVSPLLACEPKNNFASSLIGELNKLSIFDLETPWKSTGNKFITEMISRERPELIFFPSYYFIPEHFSGEKYEGNGPVYARQLFGETTKIYERPPFFDRLKIKAGNLRASLMKRIGRLRKAFFK